MLPTNKAVQVVGLKAAAKYALGDLVELNCLSDFSRPAAALSWFANNRRVSSHRGSLKWGPKWRLN